MLPSNQGNIGNIVGSPFLNFFNNTFTNNTSPDSVLNIQAQQAVVSNCLFSYTQSGISMATYEGDNLTVSNTTFRNNNATGGILALNLVSQVELADIHVESNYAQCMLLFFPPLNHYNVIYSRCIVHFWGYFIYP
jgi:hypothetical protein